MIECVHRAEATGNVARVKWCCGSDDFVDVFACRLFELCIVESLQQLDEPVAVCAHCPKRIAPCEP